MPRSGAPCSVPHMSFEPDALQALVQRYLTQDEWLRISVAYFEEPLTARELLGIAAWVLPGLPTQALDRMRTEPKVPLLILVWRLALRRPFERRERRAFRYLPT